MKNSRMKRASLLLLAVTLLFLLAACGEKQAPPAESAATPPPGTEFSDQELGISFIYPAGWTLVTQDTLNDPAFATLMQDNFDMGIEEIKNALLQAPVIFYDMARATEEFNNNANLVVVDSPGTTQAAIKKLTDAELEANLMPQFDNVGVTWVQKPTMKVSNGIAYFTYSYTHTLVGAPMTACQMTTGDKDKLYTFTYTALGDSIEAGALADLQQVIDTIKFL